MMRKEELVGYYNNSNRNEYATFQLKVKGQVDGIGHTICCHWLNIVFVLYKHLYAVQYPGKT